MSISGIPMVGKWYGAFGVYEVPTPVMWLAEKAQERALMPRFEVEPGREFWSEPYFKVVEEWGKWRDEEEAKQRAAQ